MQYVLSSYPGSPGLILNHHQPDIRPVGKRKYILSEPYYIEVEDEKRSVFEIQIPSGFMHDGASVPRIAWTFSGLTPDGLIRAPALVHDWFYEKKGKLTSKNVRSFTKTTLKLGRKSADKIFLDLMLAAGVSRYRAGLAYLAVRLFGPRW